MHAEDLVIAVDPFYRTEAQIIINIRTDSLNVEDKYSEGKNSNKIKASRSWNTIQLKWLDKIGAQLIKESVVTVEDLNRPPFSMDGGLKRLDKIFKNETSNIISELNTYLYA